MADSPTKVLQVALQNEPPVDSCAVTQLLARSTAKTTLRVCGSALVLASLAAEAEEALPKQLESIAVVERLGKQVDLNRQFVDHRGKVVRLQDYFDGKRPVLLTLNYFRCRMLCNLQLNALVNGLKELGWSPGQGYRMLTVSIDPRDTVEVARGKRANYLKSLGVANADWSFVVNPKRVSPQQGEQTVDVEDLMRTNAKRLASDVGFRYRYIRDEDQFAHAATVFFLTPDGRVSRYLYQLGSNKFGTAYDARDLKFALIESSAGRMGSPVDKVFLSCFHYDASQGRYGPFAFGVMRVGGALTVLLLGAGLALLWRREGRRRRADIALTQPGRQTSSLRETA